MNKQNELTKENIKLKEQNKLLLKKDNKNSNNEIENIRIISNQNNNDKNINLNNANKTKNNTKNNINGLMTYIKMNFKDKKNKMIKLDKYFLNKKKQNQDTINENKKEESTKNKTPSNENIIYTNEKKNSTPIDNSSNKTDFYSTNKTSIKKFTISNSSINSYNTGTLNSNNNNSNNIIINSDNKYSSKTENVNVVKNNMSINTVISGNENYSVNTHMSNNNRNYNLNKINNNYFPEKLKIKIIKGRIRKDKSGKPYLEYIININYDNIKNWNINRRFNQFTNLYKTLRTLSKENFELPESSNIFSNITAMFSGLSHENKIIQLEKYLKDLTEVPEISNSKQLYFFLELNHLYELTQ